MLAGFLSHERDDAILDNAHEHYSTLLSHTAIMPSRVRAPNVSYTTGGMTYVFACRNKHVNRALEIAETLLADPASRAQGNALAGTLKKAAHRLNHKAKVSHGKLQSHPSFMCSPSYCTGPSEICLIPSIALPHILLPHTAVLRCTVPQVRGLLQL